MSNVLDEVSSLLSPLGISTKQGTLPDKPDSCVSLVLDESENDPISFFGQTTRLEFPQVKVLVRNISYDTALSSASAVKNTLNGVRSASILGIKLKGRITDLGEDEKNRRLFEMNFILTTEE